MFIWSRKNWPQFKVRHSQILPLLSDVRMQQGRWLGQMSQLGFDTNMQTQLGTLTEDAVQTSAIEGEAVDRGEVRSSLARRLGVEIAGMQPSDAKVEGLVNVLLDATENFDHPLTNERLFGWHAALFPTGYTGMYKISAGCWRSDHDGPMQVISGRLGRQRIHFEAPPAPRIDAEMTQFIQWFNEKAEEDGLLRAALAHLWFVTVHPFEDGNGRIGRAISDMALAQSEGSGQRFYSMSGQIRAERKQYYEMLERTQRGDLDVTSWVEWFLGCMGRALDNAKSVCGAAMKKSEFWQKFAGVPLNERQRKVINLMLDGLEGKLTSPKWAKLTKSSSATAQRDIAHLVEAGVLIKGSCGSKNTHYELAN